MPKERHRSHDRRERGSKSDKREVEHRDKGEHKSKRKHKSKRSTSSSSVSTESRSPSPPASMELFQALEDRRLRDRLERKKIREELKAKETPEEKRARRLNEKKAKEIRRKQRMGWDTEYQYYTNQDNPFGDSNLTSTFVWDKKMEKDGLKDISRHTVEVFSRQKQLENKLELEKVKKRRMEREQERQQREEEMMLQNRSREAAQFKEWEQQEDTFHLEQARLRSIIRIRDGRAKPIDLLAQYVSNSKLEEAIEMQMHEPYLLLDGLGVKDLEDLLVDIGVYMELEKGGNNEFWNDMIVIVEDELQKLQKLESEKQLAETRGGRREGIHQSVVKDITEIFRGKNSTQLNELRGRIEQKINSRSDGVDVSYWESLLSQLKAHMARARLRDKHQENLRVKLKLLKTDPEEPVFDKNSEISTPTTSMHAQVDDGSAISSGDTDMQTGSLLLDTCFRQYEEGAYSPRYLPLTEEIEGALSEDQDVQLLETKRSQFYDKLHEKSMSQEEFQMRCEARKDILPDEAEFSVEAPVDTTVQLSSDKYRPRKPRYFNRVHTGFEWNKYNQTHYDMDNPPPKIVQGYKFNIFYPDLIDKSSTPQYFLTPCGNSSDFAVLRFHAGPPYEDIAFKIVNREWEFSYKRGFRCQFHNNIFQLWFHFKRYRYRR